MKREGPAISTLRPQGSLGQGLLVQRTSSPTLQMRRPPHESPCLTGCPHTACCASPWPDTTSTSFLLRVSCERETRRSDYLNPATSMVFNNRSLAPALACAVNLRATTQERSKGKMNHA